MGTARKTYSVQLVPGQDDDLIVAMEAQANKQGIIRAALRLYFGLERPETTSMVASGSVDNQVVEVLRQLVEDQRVGFDAVVNALSSLSITTVAATQVKVETNKGELNSEETKRRDGNLRKTNQW